ncbi:MAG: DUF3592 domain-containing protein [bacterium]|nr:DUF3592 domain-containing protein [bacterium]
MTKRALLGLLVVIGGALAINSGWRDLERAHASEGWPSAAGEIRTSGVGTKMGRAAGQLSPRYEPKIVYTYTVDGQSYESRTVWAGSNGISFGERSFARELVDRYPAGRAVTVYYDPANPVTAALEQGADETVYLLLGIGALFVAVGGWLMAGPLRGSVTAAWTGD